MNRRLPAEWEPVAGVLMAWPQAQSAWAPYLEAARATHAAIAAAITARARLLLAVADDGNGHEAACAAAQVVLAAQGANLDNVSIYGCPLNDTWARDFGPLTVLENDTPVLLDCGFNGWGLKFAADADNQVSRRLHAAGAFGVTPLHTQGWILEGGSIESDGAGTILTTAQCLLHPNRNPHMDRTAIDARLGADFGATRVLWLTHGHLEGDDTDAHIDTLARLCPNDTIAYVACDDVADAHHAPLAAMRAELQALRTAAGAPYRLVPLPWPTAIHAHNDGRRLPATYANFLFVNGAVLVPTYGQAATDTAALAAVAAACTGYEVVGIDCRALIEQHGSLHCVTMQLPKGVLP